jgi:hypothetical protein
LLAPPNVAASKKGKQQKSREKAVMMVLKPSLKSGTVIAPKALKNQYPAHAAE